MNTGAMARAMACRLDGEESRTAARLLAREYPLLHGVLVPLAHRLMRTQTLHYGLTAFEPDPNDHSEPES